MGLSFFWPFSFFIWDNALLMMIITLLFIYNSMITTRYLEQNMTLYECLWRCTGKGNESRMTCMINYAWWPCHKYDVNYMIMQGNMTMNSQVMYMMMMEVGWQYISRNGYANAMIGRYGGCFEEDIWWV